MSQCSNFPPTFAMAKHTIPYHRLSVEDTEQPDPFPEPRPSQSRRILLVVIFLETVALLWSILRTANPKYSGPAMVYSPAQEAVEYGITSYAIGRNEKFRIPPSPALDKAWDNLYNCDIPFIVSYPNHVLISIQVGISQIPKSQATLLPNKTHPIPGDEKNYIVELDVFHNLHCLNMIRMRVHSDYYLDSEAMEIGHLDHCIDWIRQALMCAGDTSVIVWQWDAAQNITTFQGDVVHTCRNFDKLREWGKSHAIRTHYDTSVRILDDIVVPVIPKQFDL
ncbi:Threonyl-tRNA synthetase [Mycena venus]|uniref:Threonyl-tRNA synthetase n=1 Tax=Mycena venus TaxID=2733690 RepID=A0A8H6YJF6_9AGAR|nr:Threonyl-tRNA synthetase [Mycena venus]